MSQSDGLGKVFAASKGYLLVLFTVQSGKSILEAFSDNLSRHFMVFMESCHRLLDFLKRSNVVSPTVALETATALQHKIEKATRRAQEQFQMVLEEQSSHGIGYSVAAWQPYFIALSGFHLYILESETSHAYQRCTR
ncbi:hypothetical protein OROGR_019147 [Orobanche gracilis]